jgi:hypothetical protein
MGRTLDSSRVGDKQGTANSRKLRTQFEPRPLTLSTCLSQLSSCHVVFDSRRLSWPLRFDSDTAMHENVVFTRNFSVDDDDDGGDDDEAIRSSLPGNTFFPFREAEAPQFALRIKTNLRIFFSFFLTMKQTKKHSPGHVKRPMNPFMVSTT